VGFNLVNTFCLSTDNLSVSAGKQMMMMMMVFLVISSFSGPWT